MASRMIATAAGIACVAWFGQLPPVWLLLVFCLFVSIVCLGAGGVHSRGRVLPFCFVIGIVYGSFCGQQLQSRLLPEPLEREDLMVTGFVASIPEFSPERGGTYRFNFKVEQWDREYIRAQMLRLSYSSREPLVSGQRWEFQVRLKRPRSYANPGSFDYARWLVARGIHATGYVRSGHLLAEPGTFSGLRPKLVSYLRQRLTIFSQAPIMLALTVGDRGLVSDQQWTLFRDSGISHLIAISGLHIGIAAGMGLLLGRMCGLGYRLQGGLALLFAGGYAFLAGFTIPTQRAFIMVTVAVLALVSGRKLGSWRVWSCALLLVLLWNPLAVLDVGFWLSFVAVAILLLVAVHKQDRSLFRLAGLLRSQFLIMLGLLPLSLVFFQQISWLGLPINLVAIPLFSLLLIPMLLLALFCESLTPALASPVWTAADNLLGYFLAATRYVVEHGQTLVWAFSPGAVQLAALALAAVIILLPVAFPARYLCLLLCIPFVATVTRGNLDGNLNEGEFSVQVIDVGQGLSSIIRTPNHSLVYDVGPRFGSFNLAEAAVLPVLRFDGIKQLDTLIISHNDSDHAGRYEKVVEAYPGLNLLSGQPLPGADSCRRPLSWQWDGVRFQILHPSVDTAAKENNNHSCVLLVSTGNKSVLLPGDIESAVERHLLPDLPQRITLVVAPHHGSRTSSSPQFVQYTAPEWVVFSAGYKHHFGHPAPEIVERYQSAGSEVLNTAESGMLSLIISPGDDPVVHKYRDEHRFYWQ